MAFENLGITHSFKAAADYSSKQHHFMKVGGVNTATLCSVAGEAVAGVLQDKPSAVGQACSVMTGAGGITKVVLGATLAAGDKVSAGTSGTAVACAAGYYQAGILLEGGDANQTVAMLFTPGGMVNVDAMVGRTVTLPAAGDYQLLSYPPVYINSSGAFAVQTSAGGIVNGILQNQPDTAEDAIAVVEGVSNVVLGATLNAGVQVMVEATDMKVVADTGNVTAIGTLIEGGVEDDVVLCLIQIGNLGHQHA